MQNLVLGADDPALIPVRAVRGDAGADLRSDEELTIAPGKRATVGTGIHIALEDGYAGLVYSRSGLAAKHGVFVLNAPGLIDSGYRGEVKVVLFNSGDQNFHIKRLDRIAQLVIQKVEHPELQTFTRDAFARWCATSPQHESERGAGGFGSTGV